MSTAIISGVFGEAFRTLYHAPIGFDSYLYSNNPALSAQASRKGWRFRYIDYPLVRDSAVSSLQSKYVKFLQVRHERDYLLKYDDLLYVDHKLRLTERIVNRFMGLKRKPVLITTTPRVKTSVWDEVKDAQSQERYTRFMKDTVAYIKDKVAEGYSERTRVCATGMIAYSMREPRVFELCDTVYSDLTKVGTPECQVIWCVASQKYAEIIQAVDFDRGPLRWRESTLLDSLAWTAAHPIESASRLLSSYG